MTRKTSNQGSYVKNFDPRQLEIGIWGGDATLRNLELKKEALDKFRLPLNVIEGHLGELNVQIPWSNLKNRPFKIVIQDMFLLAEPRLDEEYDAEDEEERAQALKREKLANLEILSRNTAPLSVEDQQKTQSFTESFVNKIVDNLQVTIKNIHIRYEDQTSVPGHPFSLGFTLEELSAVSTDNEWRPKFVQEPSDISRKLATLNSLAIYWNTDTQFIRSHKENVEESLSHDELMDKFRSLILSGEDETQYILRPVSGIGQLALNKKPTEKKPKRKLELIFDELGFVFDSDQYRDALWTAELFRLYMKTKDFKKYRPKSTIQEDPRAWLNYATKIVLDQILKKKREGDWNYIEQFIETRKTYAKLYVKKLEENISPEEHKELEQLEHDNTYENIRLFRSIARGEWRRTHKNTLPSSLASSAASAPATATKTIASVASSWTSWVWGTPATSTQPANKDDTSNDEETDGVPEDAIMTDEQRQELYDAIEWDENATQDVSDVDQNQISLQVDIALRTGNFRLRRDPHAVTPVDIAAVFFNGFKARFIQRSAAFSMQLSLEELQIDDKSGSTLYENVVSMTQPLSGKPPRETHKDDAPEMAALMERQGSEFFYLAFETHPADGKSDSLLYVKTKGVTIYYSAKFVENIVKFFQPPKTHLETIGALMNAAGATVEGLRNQTRIGLEYALQEHKTVDLRMELEAPLILLPLSVTKKQSACVAINAGHMSVCSDLVAKETLEEIQKKQTKQYTDEDWKELENLMYNKFDLQLHNTQILVGSSVEGVLAQLEKPEANNWFGVVSSLDLDFLVETSILPDANNLAKFRVSGKLPLFQFSMSDRQYKVLMQVIDQSIPQFDFGTADELNTVPAITSNGQVALYDDDHYSDIETWSMHSSNKSPAPETAGSSDLSQTSEAQKIFVFNFNVDQVEVNLHQCVDDETFERKPLVDMVLKGFNLEYVFKSLEMSANVNLQSLYVEDFVGNGPEELHKLVSSSSENGDMLFHVKYVRTKRSATSDINDQLVVVNLSTLRFVLEPKSSLTILDFIITTFTSPEEPTQKQITSSSDGDIYQDAVEDHTDDTTDAAPPGIDVQVNLKSIITQLSDDGIKLATLKLDSAEVAIKLQDETMNVNARLGSLLLHDDIDQGISRSSVLREIISIEGDELADLKYETYRAKDKFDHTSSLYFRSGSLRVNVIEEPLVRIVSFLSRFNQMKGLYDRARQLALNQAQIEEANRMKVDVILRAPILVFPKLLDFGDQEEPDYDLVTARLGEIYVKSGIEKYEPKTKGDLEATAACTHLEAGFRQANLTSEFHVKEGSQVQKIEMIDNIDISFDMHYIDTDQGEMDIGNVPTFQLTGAMSNIEMTLTELELEYLTELSVSVPRIFFGDNNLDVNAAEELTEELERRKRIEFPGQQQQEQKQLTVPETSPPTDRSQPKPQPQQPRSNDQLDLQFTVQTVSLTLYHGTAEVVTPEDLDRRSLSHFALNDTGIKVHIDRESYLTSDIHIHSFTVQDTRRVKDNKFPEIIPSIQHGEYQFMCHVSKRNNIVNAELTVDSPRVILATDYLLALKKFLEHASPKNQNISADDTLTELDEEDDDYVDEQGEENRSAVGDASEQQSLASSLDESTLARATAAQQKSDAMAIHFHLNVVDLSLIVLADPSKSDSEAIVFKIEQVVLSQREKLTVTLSKIGIFLCQMSHFDSNRLRVLDDFSVTGAIDTRGSDVSHEISRVLFNVEQLVLRLSLRDVLLALNIVDKASKLMNSSREEEGADLCTREHPFEQTTANSLSDGQYSRFSKNMRRKMRRNSSRRSAVTTVTATVASTSKTNGSNSDTALAKAKPKISMIRGEQMNINFEGLRFVIIGMSHELPVMDMCIRAFAVTAQNWSSNLRVDMAAESFVNVFNPSKSAWEPLIETWDIGVNISRTVATNNTLVNFFSRKMMEISLTAQTISLLSENIDFVTAKSYDEDFLLQPRESEAPYVVRNETGYTIEVWAITDETGPNNDSQYSAVIKDGEQIPWRFYDWHVMRENLSTDSQKTLLGLRLLDSQYDDLTDISVTSEGEHIHLLKMGSRTLQRIVCDIHLENQIKNIKFRSTLNLKNWTHFPFTLGVENARDDDTNSSWVLQPNCSRGIPLQLAQDASLVVKPATELGFRWSRNSIHWRDLVQGSQTLACEPDRDRSRSSLVSTRESLFYYHVEGDFDKSIQRANRYPLMTVNVCAPIEIVNLLPFDFNYLIYNKNERKDWSNSLKKGENSPVHVVQRSDLLLLSVEVADAGYSRSDFAVVNVRKKDAFERETTLAMQHRDGQSLHLKIHYA